MAEAMKIHASEIEGLDERLTEIVRQEFDRRTPMEDMEELKHSPAGTMIRLEEQVHALTKITESEFQNIDEHFKLIDERFEDINRHFKEVDRRFEDINGRFESVDKRLENLDSRMVTGFEKIDKRFENMVTKEEFAAESEGTNKRFDKLDSRMVTEFEKIDKRFEKIGSQMLTKEEFSAESERTDKRFDKLEANQVQTDKDVQKLQEMFKMLVVKIDEQEKRLSLFQKVTYAFFSTIIVILAGILLKSLS